MLNGIIYKIVINKLVNLNIRWISYHVNWDMHLKIS